jgi:transposase InsO family protein
MNIHENARTTPASRYLLVQRVEQGWTPAQAAEAAGISRKTASKWLRRYGAEGRGGLRDRSSAAHRRPHAVPPEWQDLVVYLRSFRQPARCIALQLGLPRSTVSAVLARHGLGAQANLEPPVPACRYERRHAGELLHLDIKKLGRFRNPGHRVTGVRGGKGRSLEAGWEFVHVAIDDFSRIAYAEILPDETGRSCARFMRRAKAWFAERGITIKALLTDNGTGYRSHHFREACLRSGTAHHRTRPYTPRTNGKAERFIQSLLREWAYARSYPSSAERSRVLPIWLRFYNEERPHASLAYQPPSSRRPSSCGQRS